MVEHLSAQAVEDTFIACLAEDLTGDPEQCIDVDCIVFTARFSKAAIAERRDAIHLMLLDLPVEFQQDQGGGMSFLNACQDRDDNQWTGLHRTMGFLFGLGMAAGWVACPFPREMWPILPGGMPYYIVTSERNTEND